MNLRNGTTFGRRLIDARLRASSGERRVVSGQVSGMDASGEPTVQEISPHVRAAVGQRFDDHADAIFAYAARRVGPGLAVDVVSDVFLVALDRFESFDPDLGGARGWLFGIANNVLRRHWRTEARRLRALARYTSFISRKCRMASKSHCRRCPGIVTDAPIWALPSAGGWC